MKSQTTYLSNILNSKRSKIAYILLILAICPKVFYTSIIHLTNFDLISLKSNLLLGFKDNISYIFYTFLFQVLPIFSTILMISVFEFIERRDLFKLSIFRLRYSSNGNLGDLYYYFFSLVIFRFRSITILATLGLSQISESFKNFLTNIFNFVFPNNIDIPLLPLFIFSILLMDFFQYLQHRFAHKYFWELHEFHHSATEMTIFNAKRTSLLSEIIPQLPFIPILIIASSFLTRVLDERNYYIILLFFLFEISTEIVGMLGHSSTKMIYPKPLSYVLLSPSLHWFHHSSNPKHFNILLLYP